MRALPALLVAIALVQLAPAADAVPGDVVMLEINGPSTLPPGRAVAFDVNVTMCATALAPGARQVTLSLADPPAWLKGVFEPDRHPFALVLPNQCGRATGVLRVNVSHDAPGLAISNLTIRAAEADGSWTYGHQEHIFRVGYRGAVETKPARLDVEAPRGGYAEAVLAVKNTGNAISRIGVNQASSIRGVSLAPAHAIVLEPGETGRLSIGVIPAGDAPSEIEAGFLVTTQFALDATLWGEGAFVSMTVHAHGAAAPSRVPSPGLAPLGGALAVAALLAVRRLR
ncbi:MAG TPA: hypothetical protein VM889_11655 [Candidatus Thermoplasmatota archaeon]|nr:hypothetical protein [Candidatus Thermoplasmatota archaeon]